MALTKKRFSNLGELKKHILTHVPTFYFSSKTSTVVPYDKIEDYLDGQDLVMGDLSGMPSNIQLLNNGNLIISGAVSWKDAREFLKSNNRNIMTAPTEDLALVNAGAATSCTGERSFSFGNLRSQIVRIKYLDYNANEIELHSDKDFEFSSKYLAKYQEDFESYKSFKNAPFPRFEKETDLLIGTEGQLGVITELELKSTTFDSVNHLFMLLPKWEEDYNSHLEIIQKIQPWRDDVILCELIDSNAFSYLPEEERPNKALDAIFFEIKSSAFEKFYEEFILDLKTIDENNIFELTESKFHHIRASVPRHVFEVNSKMGVVKMGTDVQVNIDDFSKLLDIYRDFSNVENVRYNLFGHFGDAHLHFNFMPGPQQVSICQKHFENMYAKVVQLKGSPFAEHGIGLIKQKFIKQYWGQNQLKLFRDLKSKHDPYNQFFPQGFMSIKSLG